MRTVPFKNYIVVLSMAIGVVIVCFILSSMYKSSGQKIYTSIVADKIISEIQLDDLDNFIQENPDAIIYICDSTKKKTKAIEKKFRKIIVDNNITKYVVYLEKTDDVIKKYDLSSDTPIFIAYQNGAITEILSKSNYDNKDIESFLVRNKVIEND